MTRKNSKKITKMKKVLTTTLIPMQTMISFGTVCMAGDIGQVTNGLNNLKLLFLGVVAIIGVIVLVKGVVDFSSALSDRDSSGMKQAGLVIGGGAVMAAISTVIGFLGF